MDTLKFVCPKCAHDRVQGGYDNGIMRCRACGFKAIRASFKVEPRPSLKWDEAREVQPDNYGDT
jgi:ribosomal protein L37AE/L43A